MTVGEMIRAPFVALAMIAGRVLGYITRLPGNIKKKFRGSTKD